MHSLTLHALVLEKGNVAFRVLASGLKQTKNVDFFRQQSWGKGFGVDGADWVVVCTLRQESGLDSGMGSKWS